MGPLAQHPKSVKTLLFHSLWGEVGGDGGPCPTPKIIDTIMISIVFGESVIEVKQ